MRFVNGCLVTYPFRKYFTFYMMHFFPIFSTDVTLNIYFAQRHTIITDIHAEEQFVYLSCE